MKPNWLIVGAAVVCTFVLTLGCVGGAWLLHTNGVTAALQPSIVGKWESEELNRQVSRFDPNATAHVTVEFTDSGRVFMSFNSLETSEGSCLSLDGEHISITFPADEHTDRGAFQLSGDSLTLEAGIRSNRPFGLPSHAVFKRVR
jgi:hypothetical protein